MVDFGNESFQEIHCTATCNHTTSRKILIQKHKHLSLLKSSKTFWTCIDPIYLYHSKFQTKIPTMRAANACRVLKHWAVHQMWHYLGNYTIPNRHTGFTRNNLCIVHLTKCDRKCTWLPKSNMSSATYCLPDVESCINNLDFSTWSMYFFNNCAAQIHNRTALKTLHCAD